MPTDIVGWVTIIIAVLGTLMTMAQTIYAHLTWKSSRESAMRVERRRFPFTITMGALVILSWGAVAFDRFTRPTQSVVDGYGFLDGGIAYMAVHGERLMQYSPLKRAVMVIRPVYADVDRMTDQNVSVSRAYTITNSIMQLGRNGIGNVRIRTDTAMTFEFDLVLIHFLFTPEQIHSLSDLTNLGGEIVATTYVTTRAVVIPPPPECPDPNTNKKPTL